MFLKFTLHNGIDKQLFLYRQYLNKANESITQLLHDVDNPPTQNKITLS